MVRPAPPRVPDNRRADFDDGRTAGAHEADDRRTCRTAPPTINPVSPETTKQAKCCGYTLVRHTRIVGFNSHRLLQAIASVSYSGKYTGLSNQEHGFDSHHGYHRAREAWQERRRSSIA